jgi:glyoxylase-like metal-dependent hydrolase (beta-lactamase superfamily II)
MALKIDILNFGDVLLDSSLLVRDSRPGSVVQVPTYGYLITGSSEGPLLVDTGYRDPSVLEIMGMKGVIPDGAGLAAELARHDMHPADVRYVVHTHLHTDHAGKDDTFPMSTTAVVNRRELEVTAGYGTLAYQPRDTKHIIDRVYTRGASWLLDLPYSGPAEIVPGVICDLAGGHTEGSMNVLVDIGDGMACICGDVIYNIQRQIVDPTFQLQYREPKTTGNYDVGIAEERGPVKKALHSGSWLLPMHDQPAKLTRTGCVVGRLEGTVIPGPVRPVDEATAIAYQTGQPEALSNKENEG